MRGRDGVVANGDQSDSSWKIYRSLYINIHDHKQTKRYIPAECPEPEYEKQLV
jgi:hypothetical protein